MGRSTVDMFFRKYLKSYLPKKNPGSHYTAKEIEKAYVDFLNDSNNDVAKFLRILLPSKYLKLLNSCLKKVTNILF